jgi:hypothetical protein
MIRAMLIIQPITGIHPKINPTINVNSHQNQNSERRARPVKSAYLEKHVLIAVKKSIIIKF